MFSRCNSDPSELAIVRYSSELKNKSKFVPERDKYTPKSFLHIFICKQFKSLLLTRFRFSKLVFVVQQTHFLCSTTFSFFKRGATNRIVDLCAGFKRHPISLATVPRSLPVLKNPCHAVPKITSRPLPLNGCFHSVRAPRIIIALSKPTTKTGDCSYSGDTAMS